MEWGRRWFLALWRSAAGTAVLYTALLTHLVLALSLIARRQHFRMPAWEALQTLLGLAIPLFLTGHIVGTRLAHDWHGVTDSYTRQILIYWDLRPAIGVGQIILLLLAWMHGCMGVHFWLRFRGWYPRVAPFLSGRLARAGARPAWLRCGRSPNHGTRRTTGLGGGDVTRDRVCRRGPRRATRGSGRRPCIERGRRNRRSAAGARVATTASGAEGQGSHPIPLGGRGRRAARIHGAGGESPRRHPSYFGVRWTWALLHLPDPGYRGHGGVAGAERGGGTGTRAHRCGSRCTPGLPTGAQPQHCCDARRRSHEPNRVSERALSRAPDTSKWRSDRG